MPGVYSERMHPKTPVKALVMKLTLPGSRLPGFIDLGADSGLRVHATFFPVPDVEDRGQLSLELLFGDLPIPECFTKMPDPNLCRGQGFKGSVSPPT